jgi:hypothetical protein
VADLFNRTSSNLGGTFSADGASITFSGLITSTGDTGGVGLLSQNMSVQYRQNISKLYEIGSLDTFLVAGRTDGGLNMARILGPRKVVPGFYQQFGDVCQAATNNLGFSVASGCGTTSASKLSFKIRNIALNNVGLSVSAADMMISDQLSATFIGMDVA